MMPFRFIDAEPRRAEFDRALKRMGALEDEVARASFDARISHLVKLRASQINGCSFCIDMHVDEALADGVDPKVLHLLQTWREVDLFDEREQAALAFTEAVTLVADGQVPRGIYDAAAAVFSEEELGVLLWEIIVINVWNRFAITRRTTPQSLVGHAATTA